MRDFVVGAQLLAELDSDEALLERMRRVQWIEDLGYRAAGSFSAARDQQQFTFAVILPGEALFFPAVDKALVDAEPGNKDLILFDAAKLPTVIGPSWTQLDEKQGCFSALDAEQWSELVARARAAA
jgi:hypothetical protein